ncbi:dGTP triphosphohydrolase [Flavobacterium qiangtangense]|uniref:dGTP triphosphohydrolase n=1 Tax=Flavobacterium qiangtangense TaxID=1442595 RepID=A0ABW1PT02_9FLAO
MDLNEIYSNKRTGISSTHKDSHPRTEYQRDFDRIIFSSAFRRLQNKTQVFPLPGSVFVHNRLTHSLEVASVGRSLGTLVGNIIHDKYKGDLTPESQDFYRYDLYNVVASACLCHDIGNPAFGHSGEDAIASYFIKNKDSLKKFFVEQDEKWKDLVNFEGNANAIRVLTHQQNGKSEGGIKLTYSTLAAIAKYPCESIAKDENFTHRKKFGFFQSEKNTFIDIAENTGMIKDDTTPLIYLRHPFVWLVEAADDICYNIIDLEDSHRLGIIEHSHCVKLLSDLITCIGGIDKLKIEGKLAKIDDRNDRISYLRAKAINVLTMRAKEIYENNLDKFLTGTFKKAIFNTIKNECDALQKIIAFSTENIYNDRNVVEIENAGYNVMYELLSHFIPPILEVESIRTQSQRKALKLLPRTFNYDGKPEYERILGVLDYISGMTDNYATDLYKRIKGIEIGMKI